MKTLYFLSGLAIFNLIVIAIIATFSSNAGSQIVIPTPQVVTKRVVKKVQQFATNAPSNVGSSQQKVAPAQTGCVVTIDGTKYDLTDFKNMHSGGDIFSCGTDMSAIFWSQHSQRQLNQLQRYKI